MTKNSDNIDYEVTKPPKELFHYTNQIGLLGIVNSQSFWTTKIFYVNDFSEYKLALALAEKTLDKYLINRNFTIENVNLLRQELRSIAQLNVFIGSFTENGDLLSQWRAYGSSEGCFSLGFKSAMLVEEANNNNFSLSKCIYDPELQERIIDSLVLKYLQMDYSKSLPSTRVDQNSRVLYVPRSRGFDYEMARVAPLLKDQSFQEEQEWRLITNRPIDSRLINFRTGKSCLIPYYELQFSNFKDLLNSIIIGPTPNQSISADSIKMLLSKFHLLHEVLVRNSFVPYRYW